MQRSSTSPRCSAPGSADTTIACIHTAPQASFPFVRPFLLQKSLARPRVRVRAMKHSFRIVPDATRGADGATRTRTERRRSLSGDDILVPSTSSSSPRTTSVTTCARPRPHPRGRGRAGVQLHTLIVDDNSPDGTGDLADELARAEPRVHGAAPRRQGGPRHRVPRRLPLGARARLRAASSRWTPTSATTRVPAALPARSPTSGADLVLGSRYVAGGGTRELGHRRAAHQPRRQPLRAHGPRHAAARPHRRLQVLPPPGARGDRPATRSTPTATASRSR